MRRMTISLVILLVLTGLGIWNCMALRHISSNIVHSLALAEQCGESGDWEGAERLTRQAQSDWEDANLFLYIVLRHDYTDEVNTGFQEVLALIQWQETPEYASANGELISQVKHFSEAEQLTIENLL